ncbi:MAG: DEAD/DEAH box helicase [Ghiorsea sp.]
MEKGRVLLIPNRKWVRGDKWYETPASMSSMNAILNEFATEEISPKAHKVFVELKKAKIPKALTGIYVPKMPPMPHQKTCIEKLQNKEAAALLMCCGSGKSYTAITLVAQHVVSHHINALLVACPFSIRRNWIKELNKHCAIEFEAQVLDFQTKKGKENFTTLLESEAQMKVLIVGVESLSSGKALEYTQNFLAATKAAIVNDESHLIKNPKSKRTKALIKLGKEAEYRYILTGTPVTQGLIDLYSQFQFLDEDIIGIGDYWSFRNTYCIMGGFENRQIIGYKNAKTLLDKIEKVTYQVIERDALSGIPDRIYEVRECQMQPKQAAVYKRIKKDSIVHGSEDYSDTKDGNPLLIENALGKVLRLQQVVGGFMPQEHVNLMTGDVDIIAVPIEGSNPKVQELLAVAEEDTSSTIIWCRFRPEIARVAQELRKKYGEEQVVEFHGGIDSDVRWANVEKFESGQARFFVGNQATGGVGIDLIKATTMVYFSNSFSYSDRAQSEARAYRTGQKHSVRILNIVMEGTVDADISKAISLKQDMSEYVTKHLDHFKT